MKNSKNGTQRSLLRSLVTRSTLVIGLGLGAIGVASSPAQANHVSCSVYSAGWQGNYTANSWCSSAFTGAHQARGFCQNAYYGGQIQGNYAYAGQYSTAPCYANLTNWWAQYY
jgi:hypothetical protein